jgi:hypothetical protein
MSPIASLSTLELFSTHQSEKRSTYEYATVSNVLFVDPLDVLYLVRTVRTPVRETGPKTHGAPIRSQRNDRRDLIIAGCFLWKNTASNFVWALRGER